MKFASFSLCLTVFGLATTLFPVVARATDRSLGLGLILFSPTGLSVNYRLSPVNSVDGALSWSGDSFDVHTDYLFKTMPLLREGAADLTAHYGIGGRMRLSDDEPDNEHGRGHKSDDRLGIRVPLGLDVWFPRASLEFFAEIVGVLDLTDSTDFTVYFAIGGRYYLRGS